MDRQEQGPPILSNVPKIRYYVCFFFTGMLVMEGEIKSIQKTECRTHPGSKPVPLTSFEIFLIEHELPTPLGTLSVVCKPPGVSRPPLLTFSQCSLENRKLDIIPMGVTPTAMKTYPFQTPNSSGRVTA